MPNSFREMADAYILAGVCVYTAAHATTFSTSLTFSLLASSVLLVNSHYLHSPIHLPSTILAFFFPFLPSNNAHAVAAFRSLAGALTHTPFFVVESVIGFLLIGLFIRLAIFRPLSKARNSRRLISPIQVRNVPSVEQVTQHVSQDVPTKPSASKPSSSQARSELNPPTSNTTAPAEQVTAPVATQPTSVATSAARATAFATLQSGSAATAAATRAALQPTPSVVQAEDRANRAPIRMRKSRVPTQSQLLATRIMAEREAEEAQHRAVVERQQAEVKAKSEAKRDERLEREKRRTLLVESVREAARGVTGAKERLGKALIEADGGRLERRRAGDQLALVKSEENEEILDKACKEAARLEMAEQVALNEVNAAQARWTDLQNQLNMF